MAAAVSITVLAGCGKKDDAKHSKIAYEPTWESLRQYPVPEWFQDAKFGIYFHWGIYSVPAFGNEWYPRNMHDKGSEEYEYHVKNYGDPSEFGYHDFIPMFRAEKFDADEWAELFQKAGAKFAGPVAEHHDGFAMWDSDLTRWDATDMGPERDIVGEIARAIRKRDMKLVTSFHHAFNWKYYELSYEGDYDTKNAEYAGLYGQSHPPGAPESEEFLKDWEAKVREVMDKYQPDYLWFDFGWKEPAFEEYKKSLLAYYYNEAEQWGKGVVVTYKGQHLPKGVGVLDLERGRLDTLSRDKWITDTSVDRNSWCYIKDPNYKSVNTLIDNLVDRVSKNGNLLLNIGPRPDGTIPEEQKELLLGIGRWLDVNGEAIYGTRPWSVYGEGPTKMMGGDFGEREDVIYTAKDIRFTAKGDALYVICLDWPGEQVTIESLNTIEKSKIMSIKMLGVDRELEWLLTEEGLTITAPGEKPCENAYAFKITIKD
ncbi:MAG: alpha-L-fucosidase [Fidelibacterota bacterium]|nr:MAG: alpha-L-fucosidase [Candidatus Neomarinimicrobiota bacterium]